MRHTLAHLLARAVRELYPHAKPAIGPAIEHGFYYDFDFGKGPAPGEKDLERIEQKMRDLLPSWTEFTRKEVTAREAREFFKGNEYKEELIDELEKNGETITFYTAGDFTDLCRGGHAEHPSKDIDPEGFCLSRIAGAYWRGSEKNPQLVRIYGLAFENKEQLQEHLKRMEEAKKRDHRLLGEQLELFTVSEEVGKGLPFWLPKGALVRRELEQYMYEKEAERGYQHVVTPILCRKELYERSGHLKHYREDMYRPIEIEGEEYFLRPMNCPHHHQVFSYRPRSYRELPLRIAEFGLVHRFERSGILTGLIRARCFTQNDAHVYCAQADLKKEVQDVLSMIKETYELFGIQDTWFRLSLPDLADKEKYGDEAFWEEASAATREALEEFGARYEEGGGEASFYGPKIDVQIRNVAGKEDTIATVQVDFYSAKRFDLEFVNEKGEKERPVLVHRAVMGSLERFFAFLIEHYAGAFPLWLAPVQARVIAVSEKHQEYASKVTSRLKEAGLRAELEESDTPLGKKIREGKMQKIPYLLVVGEKEEQGQSVSVESRKGSLGARPLEELIASLQEEVKRRV